MYCWTAKCLTAGLCASILYGAATSNVQGQTFRYEPKARADYAAPSYASPDPAPRMMHASEAVGPASARYERGYLAPRDGRGRMAQRCVTTPLRNIKAACSAAFRTRPGPSRSRQGARSSRSAKNCRSTT